MTTKSKQKAIIVSSFMLYLVSLMSNGKTKPHIKKLKKQLLDVTIKQGDVTLAKLSNEAWSNVIKTHQDDNLSISVALVIESLAFTFEKDLLDMYGESVIENVCSFTEQESVGNISDYAKDSYKAAAALSEAVRLVVFNNKD